MKQLDLNTLFLEYRNDNNEISFNIFIIKLKGIIFSSYTKNKLVMNNFKDLFQILCLKLITNKLKFNPDKSNIVTYSQKIFNNVIIDFYRKQKKYILINDIL